MQGLEQENAAARNGQPAGTVVPTGNGSTVLQRLSTVMSASLGEEPLRQAIAEILGIERLSGSAELKASAQFVQQIPIGFARQHKLLGLASDNGVMPVAVADLSSQQLDILSRVLGKPVRPVLASADQIAAAINAAYQQQTGQADAMVAKLESSDVLKEIQSLQGREDLLASDHKAPVIKLVNLMLFEAVQQQASDVHIQPYEDRVVVRMRIDGVLFDAYQVPVGLKDEIASRVKVMGRMNIAEKRLPQDGRATVQVGDRVIDLRISSVPANFGERLVIRLLDKSARLYSLGELGMDGKTLATFKRMIALEHGLILVTGPTGSGKSTTLYAALKDISATDLNVITLEDPIEYQIEGVSQIQISDRKGMTFASGLRSVLRQDPDIIMVGEIRDRETAVMAIQSALTGHLVFSTLHTNDAASAVTRLLDLGIEPYLVASSLLGVMAQRLVRKICPKCKSPYTPTGEELEALGSGCTNQQGFMAGSGCPSCRNTGYSGRMGIFELLTVSDAVRRLVQERATAGDVKVAAVKDGMRTLHDDGLHHAQKGLTSVPEVLRVTMRENL